MKKSKKLTAICVVVVIVLLISAGGVYLNFREIEFVEGEFTSKHIKKLVY